MTVGDLIEQLSAIDRETKVRLAVNPFFPMAHKLGEVTAGPDLDGQPTVYLAEDPAAVQFGYLPRPVAEALAWMEPVDPPGHHRRRRRLRAVEDDDTNG
ncbi:hypothetical protein A8W25_28260 [Streptomyces sp. ERV7]|uniref:hypothetical protein n=1 Tax=Streptomyces sp. ERV7 TaxID=1322334 RepID=UPI0007F55178|nr:hypothetical protein [Streptomyces sp. ERV7]OAR26737.1 hypothetical protein A8W25_28260 [Streptomyces sp. ERV7]